MLRTMGPSPGRVFSRQMLLEALWGERRLPRSAHDRRPRPPPAREARGRPARPGVHPHRARRRVPLPRPVNPLRSVGARLALALLVVVAGALAIVYLIVVPSLEQPARRREALAARAQRRHRRELRTDRGRAGQDFLETRVGAARTRASSSSTASPPPRSPVAATRRRTTSTRRRATTRRAARGADRASFSGGTVDARGRALRRGRRSPSPGRTVVLLVRRRSRRRCRPSTSSSGGCSSPARSRSLVALGARLRRRLALRAPDPAARGAADRIAAGALRRAGRRRRPRRARPARARVRPDARCGWRRSTTRAREFIANASHELRTPLFSLGGFLELLDGRGARRATRAPSSWPTMREQVDRLTKLATDLLDLSRLDAGRLRVEREPRSRRGRATRRRRVRARSPAPTALARGRSRHGRSPALGDEERVLQIGRVLVENALVHTPPGTPCVSRVATGGGRCSRSRTTGPGSRPSTRAHVFERFYRLDGPRASGSGLGLAIARELARAMDGALDARVRAGPDACSRCALPVGRSATRRTGPSLASRFHVSASLTLTTEDVDYSETRCVPHARALVAFGSASAGAALVLLRRRGRPAGSRLRTHDRRRQERLGAGARRDARARRAAPRHRLRPGAIYAQRSPGVVTIYSIFGTDATDGGAGLRLRRLARRRRS